MPSKKRHHSQFDNAKHKRRNHEHSETSKPVDTMYRILCPIKKIGSVLGKGGSIVNSLRDETHAKIRVADAIPDADERVIIIYSYLSDVPGPYDGDQDVEDSDLVLSETEQMKPHCPAQDALLKVHDRIAADELLHGSSRENEDEELDEVVTARLLVPKNQVGCLLGKGGHIIQKLRSDTGANIRILPAEHLPPCAMGMDELVQMSGIPVVARRALYEVSTLLYQHPRKENPPLEDVIYASTHGLFPPGAYMAPPVHGKPSWPPHNSGTNTGSSMSWYGGYGDDFSRLASDRTSAGRVGSGETSEEFSVKIMCSAAKIGVVIGKGGANVRQLQQQTGANIHVENTSDAEQRVIVVSSREAPWDPISPTVEAILQLQSRTSETSDKGITTTLIVPSSKVGCLLGQGGHIITEMRRRTKADIRVYSKEDKPQYASANEEVVQITGNQSVARDVLSEIVSRLRERTLQAIFPADNHAQPPRFQGFSSSESLKAIGLSPSGMVGAARIDGYENMKVSEQAMSYRTPPTSSGYPIYNNSMDTKIPNSAVDSFLGMGGNSISYMNQVPGVRAKLRDPQFGAPESAGSSEQMNAARDHLHTFSFPAGRSLAGGGENFQSLQGHYPY
uniref:KH domain-containing protein At4g18375 n=1 Tax=Anthurium amnicola TaxID=1678845 RepID=A0A1D1XZ57_9ARAE